MDEQTRLRITQWRKRLERRGWISLRRGAPVRDRLVEYHVIWQGWIVSGRVRLRDLDPTAGYWEPGTPMYLLERGKDVEEGGVADCAGPGRKAWPGDGGAGAVTESGPSVAQGAPC